MDHLASRDRFAAIFFCIVCLFLIAAMKQRNTFHNQLGELKDQTEEIVTRWRNNELASGTSLIHLGTCPDIDVLSMDVSRQRRFESCPEAEEVRWETREGQFEMSLQRIYSRLLVLGHHYMLRIPARHATYQSIKSSPFGAKPPDYAPRKKYVVFRLMYQAINQFTSAPPRN